MMRRALRWALVGLWIVLLMFGLGRFWYWIWTYHTAYFPNLPETAWAWLSDLLGAKTGEDVADVETLVILVFSLLQASAITGALLFGLRRLKR